MRNLNEQRRNEGDVVPFEQRTQTPVEETALFPKTEAEEFRTRWSAIQTTFVDDPRKALDEADKFITSAIQRISQIYSDERTKMEGSWKRNEKISTEDMRIALQRYRAFFTRLISI